MTRKIVPGSDVFAAPPRESGSYGYTTYFYAGSDEGLR